MAPIAPVDSLITTLVDNSLGGFPVLLYGTHISNHAEDRGFHRAYGAALSIPSAAEI